jgi:hypothetical protein
MRQIALLKFLSNPAQILSCLGPARHGVKILLMRVANQSAEATQRSIENKFERFVDEEGKHVRLQVGLF